MSEKRKGVISSIFDEVICQCIYDTVSHDEISWNLSSDFQKWLVRQKLFSKILKKAVPNSSSKVLQKRHWIENLFWKAGTKMNIFSWHGSWKGFERLSLPNHSSTQAPMSHRTLSKVALSLSLFTCLTSSTLRTAAVYVTTSLYDFHERQAGLIEVAGNAGIQADIQESMWDEVAPLMFL